MKRIRQSLFAWILACALSASGGIALGQTATPLPTVAPKLAYPTPVPTKCLKCPTPTPTPTAVLPGVPTNVMVTQAMPGSTKVQVKWTAPTIGLPILSYTLQRYTNGVADNTSTAAGTYTSFTAACASIGVTCGYSVKATNSVGSSKASPVVSITTK